MILDVIFAAVLFIAVWIGIKRGFIRSVIGFISLLLSIVVASCFYQHFLGFMQTVPLLRQIQEQLTTAIVPMLSDNTEQLPSFILRFLPQEAIMNGVTDISAWIAASLTQVLLFLIFTVLLHIVIRLLAQVLLALTHLPVIRQCNRLLGGGFGAVTGILLCYLLAAVIAVISMNPAYTWLSDELSRSVVCNYFYTHNLIINLVLGLQ